MQKLTRKHRDVLKTVRARILAGEYAPGARLPNRSDMGSEFSVGMATVQRALDSLITDGFVRARPRAGTFVSAHPPHLCNVALSFHVEAASSLFFVAIRKAAERIATGDSLRFDTYYTTDKMHGRRDWQRLCDDAANHRVGGLIFCTVPYELLDTPALNEPGLPRVVIGAGSIDGPASVYVDLQSFRKRAVTFLRSRGRKRIAHIAGDATHIVPGPFKMALRSLDPSAQPYWIQLIPPSSGFRSAADVVDLLMRLEGPKRPDALVIHDDNLIEPVIAGLLSAGVSVGDEIEIVAHANFPSPVNRIVPMTRLGFDCLALLERCLEVIEMQRRGEQPPALSLVPALFEEELRR